MILGRLTALSLACALAYAQTPQSFRQDASDQSTVFRVDVNLVQVDAVVTDSEDRPVTGLQAEDFIIFQDGQPQEITNFSYVKTKDSKERVVKAERTVDRKRDVVPAPLPPSMPLKKDDIRRTVALVVDDLALSFDSTVRVRESLRKWVDQEMQPGDLVAVILTGVGLGALQQFTSDTRLLYSAIDRIRFNVGRIGVASFAPLQPIIEDSIDTTTFTEERKRAFTMGSLGAIQYIVNGLKELPGRKSLILFSENMPLFFKQNNSIFIDFYRSQLVQEQLRRLVEAANRSAVVIHAIDPRGVVYTGLTAEDNTAGRAPEQIGEVHGQRLQDLIDSQDGMINLARETGGLFIQGDNDIRRALRTAVEDGEGYYLIGYQPDARTVMEMSTGASKYHRIRVRVKRKGLRVRSRTGFFSTPDRKPAPGERTRQERIVQALYSPFTSKDLHVQLTALFSQTKEKKFTINALLHFDAHDLTFTEIPDGWYKTVVDVVAATFGADGQQVDVSDKRWVMQAKGETLEKMKENGIALLMNVPVRRAGAYQMRVVLCDVESELLGSATRFIEVPDIGDGHLMLSGIVLEADALRPLAVLDEEGSVFAYEATNASAAVRIFQSGTTAAWASQIFNAKTDEDHVPRLQLQTRLFREGREVFSGEPTALTPKATDDLKQMFATGRLHLAKAPPGSYAIQVVVLDMLANKKHRIAAQSMDFEVRDPEP